MTRQLGSRPSLAALTGGLTGIRPVVLAVAALALGACGSSESAHDTKVGRPAEPAPRGGPGCREEGPRYLAFLASGACRDVESTTSEGTWVARSLFPGAPAAVRDSACSYQWTAPQTSETAKPADVQVLSTLKAEHLARELAVATPCEAPLLPAGSASLSAPRDEGGGGASAPTGVSGCDVCARVSGSVVFVILPPDMLDLRTVVVTTVTGKYLSFDVDVPAGTQAFSVELPRPSEELYNEGRVPLFRTAL